jgi:hypothetical protein
MRVLTALSVEGLVCFDDLSRSLGRVNLLMGPRRGGQGPKDPLALGLGRLAHLCVAAIAGDTPTSSRLGGVA